MKAIENSELSGFWPVLHFSCSILESSWIRRSKLFNDELTSYPVRFRCEITAVACLKNTSKTPHEITKMLSFWQISLKFLFN